ncbi:hypothetical protein L0P44_14235, partial [Streptococcus gordonii]|nr:hypothetical protein [Streptococcus gordonii]
NTYAGRVVSYRHRIPNRPADSGHFENSNAGLGTNGISLIPKIMYNSNTNWNQTKTMEMNEALIYLQEALGLSAKTKTWPGSA